MLGFTLSLALGAAALAPIPPAVSPAVSTIGQTAASQAAETSPAGAPTDLGDVVIEGRRLEEATRDFVATVGQPARGRALARWRDGVCVGVANLRAETAQYIVDRVSTVAQDLGLKPGAPGCTPGVLIVATTDANAFTEAFVARRPRLFVLGGSGTDLGRNALEKFQTTDRPVRWWTVSLPVDRDTGEIAVRLPGHSAPIISRAGLSTFSTQIVDDTGRVFVIIDIDRIDGVSLTQLGDYIAMVSLAQVDPDADTSAYATVLNLFDTPEQVDGLTEWDMAYLHGLYESQRILANPGASRDEIASSIVRVRRQMVRNAEGPPPTP